MDTHLWQDLTDLIGGGRWIASPIWVAQDWKECILFFVFFFDAPKVGKEEQRVVIRGRSYLI